MDYSEYFEMKDSSDKELITAIRNLTDSECKRLEAVLHQHKIPFITDGHGPQGKYQSYYFEIRVEARHAKEVSQIVAKHTARMFLERKICPRCGSLVHKKVENVDWPTKIYYWGTTLVECKKCKTRFGI